VWARADLVLKVKEPQPDELDQLRPGLVLFTYLHLAAYPQVADALLARRVTGVAYETVQVASGALPCSRP
jgi:alanine dehydrogenase